MKRPTGWLANPQAMAAATARESYSGHADLSLVVDPDTWLTPRVILSELGLFDLDPCAALGNPAWVCERYFTVHDSGLTHEWRGRVFMNPPFSNTAPWLEKHAAHGDGVSLVPASVESRVWRRVVWARAKAILLLHGRTHFCNPDGSVTTGRPLRSIALVGWSDADALILRRSSLAGVLLANWEQR